MGRTSTGGLFLHNEWTAMGRVHRQEPGRRIAAGRSPGTTERPAVEVDSVEQGAGRYFAWSQLRVSTVKVMVLYSSLSQSTPMRLPPMRTRSE